MSPQSEGVVKSEAKWFSTTHWSVVLAAKEGDCSAGAAAMEKLCRTYWPPLYAFVRRNGHNETEAQDLTQEFFARLLERDYLERIQHHEGKFRSFLLTFLKHFLAEQRRRAGAQKRGGGQAIISFDANPGEAGYLLEPVDELTPDQVFERRWAQTILQAALNRLRAEHEERGLSELFEHLQEYQPRESGGQTYAELAQKLGMTEAAVKSAMLRMRRRYQELIREEIAHTVRNPGEIDEELQHFRELLRTGVT